MKADRDISGSQFVVRSMCMSQDMRTLLHQSCFYPFESFLPVSQYILVSIDFDIETCEQSHLEPTTLIDTLSTYLVKVLKDKRHMVFDLEPFGH